MMCHIVPTSGHGFSSGAHSAHVKGLPCCCSPTEQHRRAGEISPDTKTRHTGHR